jgi:hypothetical protein
MGSTQREETFPAPPPYQPTINETVQYLPPSGPPHRPCSASERSETVAPNIYAPPPDPPPSDANIAPGPPPLSDAPPIYEPFSFSTAFARSHNVRAPKWHAPPSYDIYHDSINATLTFHITLPSTEPPCACSDSFVCACGRRRPAIWQATSLANGGSKKQSIELIRLSPFSGSRQVAYQASNDGLIGSSSSLAIRDERGRSRTQIKKRAGVWSFKEYVAKLHGQRG